MRVYITEKSKNGKTGPIPVSTSSRETCPPSCPLYEGGCYAAYGPVFFRWQEVTRGERGGDWQAFCERVWLLPDGQLWRHNQAGDLPGEGDAIDGAMLGQLVRANRGKRGFTYTHKPPSYGDNAVLIALANHDGFTVNLSGNNLAHADELADLGIGPVVTVLPAEYERKHKGDEWLETLEAYRARLSALPEETPSGQRMIVCPATYRDEVTCASCQLCQRRDRDFIVGFPAHGQGKSAASKVAKGE